MNPFASPGRAAGNAGRDAPYKIGMLAYKAGVSPDTVRYYEKQGLLPLPARRPSGYRQYGEHDLRSLRFILRAKAYGFPLADIRALLEARRDPAQGGAQLHRIVHARAALLHARIEQLRRDHEALLALAADGPGSGPVHDSPIEKTLSGRDEEPAHDDV